MISLYLSLATNQNGREDHEQFVRKVFNERAKALPAESPERESFDKDAERIQEYLGHNTQPGRAWRSSRPAESDLFEAIPLDTPIDEHRCSSARCRTCIRSPSSSRTIRATRR